MTNLTPAQRRWRRFTANKRGYYSLWIFSILFTLSLFAEVLSNDKPLIVFYEGEYYFPLLKAYPKQHLMVILKPKLTIGMSMYWTI